MTKRILLLALSLLSFVSYAADTKVHKSEPHALQSLDIPDLKDAEVCLASTQDSTNDKMYWLLTCLDNKRKYLYREKKIAFEKPAGEDETSYGDLEMTVELQNRGFRLASTQEGLFFVRK